MHMILIIAIGPQPLLFKLIPIFELPIWYNLDLMVHARLLIRRRR